MLRLAVAILLTVALQPAMSQLPHTVGLSSQQGLARLLFTSRITALNPQVSVACFTDYIGHSNSISETYGQDYKHCLLEASEERKQIDSDSAKERRIVVAAAEAVCKSLRACNEHNNTLELFNCHTKIGSENTKSTYSISGNASEHTTVLQERYRRIELHHQQCCQRAERRYVTETASNYNYLQGCLDGRVKPRLHFSPTTLRPTTSSTTTTTTTTVAPPPPPPSPPSPPSPPPSPTPTTLPPSPSAYDELTTTEQTQNIQKQVAQILNLLN